MYPFVFFLSLFLAPRLGTAVLHGPCASAVLAPHPQLHQRQALGLASPGAGLPRMSMDVWWLKLQMSILGSVHLEGRHSRTTGPPRTTTIKHSTIHNDPCSCFWRHQPSLVVVLVKEIQPDHGRGLDMMMNCLCCLYCLCSVFPCPISSPVERCVMRLQLESEPRPSSRSAWLQRCRGWIRLRKYVDIILDMFIMSYVWATHARKYCMRLPKMKPPNGSWSFHLICSTRLGIQNSSPTPKAPTERISSILRPGQGPIKPTSNSSCTLMIKQKLQLQRDWRNHKEVFFARESGFIQLLQKSWRLLCFSRK
jgi:hypothetical protein